MMLAWPAAPRTRAASSRRVSSRELQLHAVADARAKMACRRTVANGDLEISPAVPQCYRLSFTHRGIVWRNPRNLYAAEVDRHPGSERARELVVAQITRQVAEAVDVDHLGLDGVVETARRSQR